MYFVFIIDTSLSMAQTFDNISYLDIAKSSVRKFVYDREMNNYRLNHNKYDKYFLITLNQNIDENFFFKSWSSTTDQFIYQLNALKISYDFTNIDTAIQNSFKLLNFIKKIGQEKHVYGRLFSKIQNAVIILITDGGYFSNSEKILNFNNSNISLKDDKDIVYNFPNIYKELYRWEYRFYAIILTNKNEEFESYKILDKMCKNIGGNIINVENQNILNEKLNELSNKYFQNSGVLINFIINKSKKKNLVTFLEYNGKIEEFNEKWLFPDELIINKNNKFLPTKNAIPIYELGSIKYNFKLSPDFYDKYEIKDKKFILNILIEADCWNNLSLFDFLKEYKTSITIDILVNGINNKELKKPFAILNLILAKELIDKMKETVMNKGNVSFVKFFSDYQSQYYNPNGTFKSNQKINGILNYIKCEFLNLPYYYTEILSFVHNYKFKKIEEPEFLIYLEKYCKNIPFYYIKKIIKFLERNKIKQFSEKEHYKKMIIENFSFEVNSQIEYFTRIENDNIFKIHKLIEENKNLMMKKRSPCYLRDMLNETNNNQYMMNIINEDEEDKQYLNFIDKAFQIDKISNINQMNNMNLNNDLDVYINNNNLANRFENDHEIDIELMGVNREYFFRNEHPRSYLIPEIELRYLIKDYLFGNQFIERKIAYSKQGTNISFSNSEVIQEDTIFNYINEEENNILCNLNINTNNNTNINNNTSNNTTNSNSSNNNNSKNNINQELLLEMDSQLKKINSEQQKEKELKKNKNKSKNLISNKRNRESKNKDEEYQTKTINDSINTDISSSNDPPEPIIFSDNYSETDGSKDLMYDEISDNKNMSKMTSLLLEDFKNSFNEGDLNIEPKEGIKVSIKYEISKEKLKKWKFQKKIKNFSQELIKSIHNDGINLIQIINNIIDENYFKPDKKMSYNFIEKIYKLCQDYGVSPMVQVKLKNLMKCYS